MLATIFKMTRPVNIAIAMVTLVIGYFLVGLLPGQAGGINPWSLVAELFGFAFAIGFANIQNDILDLDSDRMNRPERPLVSGKITLTGAKKASAAMAVLTILCGFADSAIQIFGDIGAFGIKNLAPAIFFTLLSALLIAYNVKLKHIPLLKNMTVAFLCATPLILTWLYPGASIGKLYPAMLFAFLLTTAREIYKDLEDEIGDLKAGIMTFPLIAGAGTARKFAGALLLFTWILLPLPVMQGFYPTLFIILTAATLTPCFAIILIQASGKKNYRLAQKMTKLAMFAGLLALIASEIAS